MKISGTLEPTHIRPLLGPVKSGNFNKDGPLAFAM